MSEVPETAIEVPGKVEEPKAQETPNETPKGVSEEKTKEEPTKEDEQCKNKADRMINET